MSMITLIVAFGVALGLVAIAVVVLFDRFRRATGTEVPDTQTAETPAAALGIGNLPGPMDLIARTGQHDQPHMSLGTVVMRPTKGLRLISLGGSALVLFLLWGPFLGGAPGMAVMKILVTLALGYAALFVAGYEARYDGEGITAPDWAFRDRQHAWEHFVSIKDDGHYMYKLRFESGTLMLQKHLRGIPTFLAFVADVRKLSSFS